jgi:hypothetical protein
LLGHAELIRDGEVAPIKRTGWTSEASIEIRRRKRLDVRHIVDDVRDIAVTRAGVFAVLTLISKESSVAYRTDIRVRDGLFDERQLVGRKSVTCRVVELAARRDSS